MRFRSPKECWINRTTAALPSQVLAARGTLHVSYAILNDKTGTRPDPAGSVIVVADGTVHYDGADEDMVMIHKAAGMPVQP